MWRRLDERRPLMWRVTLRWDESKADCAVPTILSSVEQRKESVNWWWFEENKDRPVVVSSLFLDLHISPFFMFFAFLGTTHSSSDACRKFHNLSFEFMFRAKDYNSTPRLDSAVLYYSSKAYVARPIQTNSMSTSSRIFYAISFVWLLRYPDVSHFGIYCGCICLQGKVMESSQKSI